MKRTDEWERFIGLVENFMYGDNGIFDAAVDSEELETYVLDTQYVVEMLEQYNKVLEIQGELTEQEQKELDSYIKTFLEMDSGNKKIINIYNKIKEIYENIEEYTD